MKNTAFALVLLACTAPAAAQQVATPQPRSAPMDAARLLSDPAAQQVIALQIASLAGIVLDTKVGPLAALADPRDHVRPDDTLHSVERRRDPDFDHHLYESSRRAVATTGAIAGGAAAEAAELRRTAARLRAALGPLIDAAGALKSEP